MDNLVRALCSRKKKACQGVETGPARVQIIQQEALETRKAKFRYLAIGMEKRQADQGSTNNAPELDGIGQGASEFRLVEDGLSSADG